MHKNTPVLEFDLDTETNTVLGISNIFNDKHIPLGIAHNDIKCRVQLNDWWRGRSIPASREYLEELLTLSGLHESQDMLLRCNGLSLSDQYWVKLPDADIRWESVNFFTNNFSEDIGNLLLNSHLKRSGIDFNSPDNTSDGMLKKKWKIINGIRYLVKAGNKNNSREPFNEVIASILLASLSISHVEYSLVWEDNIPCSICPNFLNENIELITARYIMQTEQRWPSITKYGHFIDCCEKLKIPNAVAAMDDMILVDYLIANEDRHYNNFGAIRKADTLQWLGITPIYDNGLSFGCNSDITTISQNADTPCRTFKSNNTEQLILVSNFNRIDRSKLMQAVNKIILFLSEPRVAKYINNDRAKALVESLKYRIEKLCAIKDSKIKASTLSTKDTIKLMKVLEKEGIQDQVTWCKSHPVEHANLILDKYSSS